MTLDIAAPMASTVVSIEVAVGDSLAPGAVVAIVDVMKMEHHITVSTAVTVSVIHVAVGDLLTAGQAVVAVEPTGNSALEATDLEASVDLDEIPELLAELNESVALTTDEGRPHAVAKRTARGQRTARANIADLCDDDSFVEYGQLAVAAQRSKLPLAELRKSTAADGIITGIGTVDGRSVAVLAVDATVIAGTQGFWHHKKIDRVLEVAEHDQIPVVFFPEGGGGRPYDPDSADVVTAGLHITSFAAMARLSGQVPVVAVVSGRCFAGSAALAGLADVIIATENANLGMAGPAMVEGGGMGVYEPAEIGPMSVQGPNGTVDVVVVDEAEAVAVTKRYLGYFGAARGEASEAADQRALRHLLPDSRRRAYEIRPVLDALFDADSLLELRPMFARAAITALGRLDGHAVGVVASDPMHQAGAIGPAEADKIARFYRLCDAHGLPIVVLCDCPGFMVGPEVETAAHVRHVSRLFLAGAEIGVPILAVLVRKAYGLGAMAMVGGGLHAPRLTLAWPTAEIGAMGFEGQVTLGMKAKLDAIADDDERQATFDAAVERLLERGRAVTAAAHLEFDAVIDPAETRRCLAGALAAAQPIRSGTNPIDAW